MPYRGRQNRKKNLKSVNNDNDLLTYAKNKPQNHITQITLGNFMKLKQLFIILRTPEGYEITHPFNRQPSKNEQEAKTTLLLSPVRQY